MKLLTKIQLSGQKRQYAWFIALWFAGLLTTASVAYLLKFIIKLLVLQ